MDNNIFNNCNTDSEVMKEFFRLAETGEYDRRELVMLSNRRREEIKNKLSPNINLIKIIIPKEKQVSINEHSKGITIIGPNSKSSTTFEFLGDNMIKF